MKRRGGTRKRVGGSRRHRGGSYGGFKSMIPALTLAALAMKYKKGSAGTKRRGRRAGTRRKRSSRGKRRMTRRFSLL